MSSDETPPEPTLSEPGLAHEVTVLKSPVDRIYAAGFRFSKQELDEPCHGCGHRWGDHELVAVSDPLDGGFCLCPVEECSCTTTWAAKHGFKDGAEARSTWANQAAAKSAEGETR